MFGVKTITSLFKVSSDLPWILKIVPGWTIHGNLFTFNTGFDSEKWYCKGINSITVGFENYEFL